MNQPLQSSADFERALDQVRQRLEGLPTAGPEGAEVFEDLLNRIIEYHEDQPPTERQRNLERMQALEAHMNAYGLRWPKPQKPADHWAPMLGGELNPP
jgi:hypothetical protein